MTVENLFFLILPGVDWGNGSILMALREPFEAVCDSAGRPTRDKNRSILVLKG
jgi:hypothetical protein